MGQSGKGGDSLSVVCHSELSRIVVMIAGRLVDVKSDHPSPFNRCVAELRSQTKPLQDN
jgi:hypothetical protein